MRIVAMILALLTTAIVSAQVVPDAPAPRASIMKAATRHYPGLTAEQVLDGVAKALAYSGGEEFGITHNIDSVEADRSYLSAFYLIAANTAFDEWLITARDTPDGAKAVVSIKRQVTQQVAAASGTQKPLSSFTMIYGAGDKQAVATSPLATLFWSRVDYSLGLSKKWTTCTEAKRELQKDEADSLAPLCAGTSIAKWADNIPSKDAPRCHGDDPVEVRGPNKEFVRCVSEEEASDMRAAGSGR